MDKLEKCSKAKFRKSRYRRNLARSPDFTLAPRSYIRCLQMKNLSSCAYAGYASRHDQAVAILLNIGRNSKGVALDWWHIRGLDAGNCIYY